MSINLGAVYGFAAVYLEKPPAENPEHFSLWAIILMVNSLKIQQKTTCLEDCFPTSFLLSLRKGNETEAAAHENFEIGRAHV